MNKAATSLRSIQFKKAYLPHAEGSCLINMGRTQVLCVASVEDKAPAHAEEKGWGWVHAEYAMLPRAGEKRSSRGKVSTGGRAQEISRLVGRSLRAAVDPAFLAPYAITVDCDVLRADGGTRTASVNGGMVALAMAIQYLKKKGQLVRWPLKEFVGAVSVGMINGKPVLDMCYEEDKDAGADVNIVMTESGKLIEVQGTAESVPFSRGDLDRMIALAHAGIKSIISRQKKTIGRLDHSLSLK